MCDVSCAHSRAPADPPTVFVGAPAVHAFLLRRQQQLLWRAASEMLDSELAALQSGQLLAVLQTAGLKSGGGSNGGGGADAGKLRHVGALCRVALDRARSEPPPAARAAASSGGGQDGGFNALSPMGGLLLDAAGPGGVLGGPQEEDVSVASLRPLILQHVVHTQLRHLLGSFPAGAAALHAGAPAPRRTRAGKGSGPALMATLGRWLLHGSRRQLLRDELDRLVRRRGVIPGRRVACNAWAQGPSAAWLIVYAGGSLAAWLPGCLAAWLPGCLAVCRRLQPARKPVESSKGADPACDWPRPSLRRPPARSARRPPSPLPGSARALPRGGAADPCSVRAVHLRDKAAAAAARAARRRRRRAPAGRERPASRRWQRHQHQRRRGQRRRQRRRRRAGPSGAAAGAAGAQPNHAQHRGRRARRRRCVGRVRAWPVLSQALLQIAFPLCGAPPASPQQRTWGPAPRCLPFHPEPASILARGPGPNPMQTPRRCWALRAARRRTPSPTPPSSPPPRWRPSRGRARAPAGVPRLSAAAAASGRWARRPRGIRRRWTVVEGRQVQWRGGAQPVAAMARAFHA
jgi:hypothetical protein